MASDSDINIEIVEDTPINIELVATGPAGSSGGGGMEIGAEVIGATPLRALSVDENGDLTDAYLSLALGETYATAYRGDRGKIAYDHSQLTSGNPHNVTKANVGLGNSDNTSDANKPVSTATQTALNLKLDTTAYDDATTAETNTGTSTAKYVSPDGLAGSYAGTKVASVYAIEAGTVVTTGDGKAYLRINSDLNGMNLVSVSIAVITTSSSGLPTVQLARGRQSSATSAHTFADMLSTKVTIDATEYDSKDATTPAVIDTANDDVATGDLIRIDVDVAGTGTAGLILTLAFRLP